MSKVYLINPVSDGGRTYWPGSNYDSNLEAKDIANIKAMGGIFGSDTNGIVTAAANAEILKHRAGGLLFAAHIMGAAYSASVVAIPDSPSPSSGILIGMSFLGISGVQTLMALTPGNIIRLNQITVLTPFTLGSTITLGTVLNPGLVLSLADPTADVYLSSEYHEIFAPDFLVLTVSPSNPSGTGRLIYGIQS